jgi:hypothetical protein
VKPYAQDQGVTKMQWNPIHKVTFVPSGRGKARCSPNPNYPEGIAFDDTPTGTSGTTIILPYPAPECGYWDIQCGICGQRFAITAAGRPDDPVSIKHICRENFYGNIQTNNRS